ncbi:MAG TPA: hypothetical protein VE010_00990 [Thermoanaerobaculia bacterium]|nr:hypothetical protein [Thermoanaerobaculia bacterium]
MTRRITTLSLFVSLLVAANAFAALEGAWTARPHETKSDEMQFSMSWRSHHMTSTTMRVAEFSGLTQAQIRVTTNTPVTFQLRRDAGIATFDGSFRNGLGAGQFTFAPNANYLESMRNLGVSLEASRKGKRERDEAETLMSYAIHDVSLAYVRSMQAAGYRVSLDDYLKMRIFDVTPEYIREMRELGFRDMDDDELVGTRIHRVTPAYVREMRAAGWNLSLEDLQSTRIHGATPQFAAEMKKLGYGDLDIQELVGFRIHRVTPEFVTELRELGYTNVDASDLVAMRIHRVTPEFIRQVRDAGYRNVPVEKLVSMRIAGIDAEYLKKMRK